MVKEKKTILFIGSFLSSKIGTKGIAESLSDLLGDQGWDAILVSSRPERVLRFLDILGTIWSQRREYHIAHVDVYSGWAFVWAEIAVILLGFLRKPYVLTLRGGGLVAFACRFPARTRRILQGASAFTTPSRSLYTELKQFRHDIKHLPNGLALSHYDYRLRATPEPRLCWLRAFHEIYNPTVAVEVVDILRETFPDVHLAMIGPDKKDGSFEKVVDLVREKGLKQHIDFVGPVPKKDVPLWLEKYDVFLNTTQYESFGVGVMEAGAVGLLIVTTNVGELPYLWTDGESALLVPSDDAAAMARAVERILTEPGLAAHLSRHARENAEQYDWSVILPKWECLFEDLLEREAGGSEK